MIDTIRYEKGSIYIIDQTKLPTELVVIEIDDVKECWDAIKELKVRGAPAIGIAAAYGVVVGVKDIDENNFENFYKEFKKVSDYLASSRPTAVNLFWALERMNKVALDNKELPISEIKSALEKEAILIHKEDEETCRKIGENGLEVLKDGMTVLTHCNAGRLATAKYGTALAPIYIAKEKGMNIKVFADETRPLLQGSRLTAFELQEAGVDVTLITDNMAAMVMGEGKIDLVIVGCDRVAANGDTANKIGTYGVALLAKAHNIPFYIAGPLSTIDLDATTKEEIPIEERGAEEIINGFGKQTAPSGIKVYNPAFDVTPHDLIAGIITEKGIARPPYNISLKKLFEK
ncbi:methylthioribose-1-phosphate isomerase [Tissierella praeacuta DSM 18095]|uniref:Methylthioribose-1-phosphate isomerase n=1 Tax=Tissierella praeacuta DSM 18095 TaxID=1123404 RepID=A0A1M4VKY6_9FIRM|nr:S-methyl-5-thioribose-1-phosphate isomerase [Tissierella praeacuta]SHE69654.1 methylthioribose-1-phosphate isomerase [Tissierella praeacuta DSM 18095]SUO99082.1 Methylthioribose-1-phosphate isomerase [Tissierella praeacuta]